MRIADLDLETKKVIYLAHIVAKRPSDEHIVKLRAAVDEFDRKHEAERDRNLINALWGLDGTMNEEDPI